MAEITRRKFVAGASAVPVALSLGKYAFAFDPKVRYNATSAEGKEMLVTYAQGVGAMKGLGATDPTSWNFQWYIHSVKGGTTKAAEIQRIFGGGGSPQKTLAEAIWSTCAPHFGGDQRFFLPWHRMYLYYFETIIRAITGNDDFTLPYWNYTADAVIPGEFRDPGSPLYVADRNVPSGPTDRKPDVNGGQAINRYAPAALNPASALGRIRYSAWFFNTIPGFCDDIETGVHNNVHGLVGNARNMGSVRWAANDPVFWLHHCNIDRLWASWNRSGGANPDERVFLDKQYRFADSSGDGVNATAGDFLDISALGYTYQEFARAAQATAVPAQARERRPVVLYRMPARRVLTAAPTHIYLKAAQPHGRKSNDHGRHAHQPAETGKSWYLVLKDFEANKQPGVIYDVFLHLPGGSSPSAVEAHKVGLISFFDAMDTADRNGSMMADFYSFDITDLAPRIKGEPRITLAPIGIPATGSNPSIGSIEVVEADVSSEDKP